MEFMNVRNALLGFDRARLGSYCRKQLIDQATWRKKRTMIAAGEILLRVRGRRKDRGNKPQRYYGPVANSAVCRAYAVDVKPSL
jgi:hypothetical protein